MLTYRGIEAKLEKCTTIIAMRILNTLKEVQRLIGRLATLSRFLSRVAYTTKPFFKLLKKQEGTKLNEECEAHFEHSKNSSLHHPSSLDPNQLKI